MANQAAAAARFAEEERSYYLGGGTTADRWWKQWPVYVALSSVGLFAVVTITISQSVWVLLGWGVVAAVVAWLLLRRTRTGAKWTGGVAARLRTRLAHRFGWDTFDPSVDEEPLALGRMDFYAPSATEGDPEMSIIDHLDENVMTGVLEIEGGGEGLVQVWQANKRLTNFGNILLELANPEIPVEEVAMMTRVTDAAADAGRYRQWINDRLRPDLPGPIRQSMDDLAGMVDDRSEAFRTFVVVRMPISELRDHARLNRGIGGDDLDMAAVAESAYEVVGDVGAMFAAAGYRVQRAMPPRSLGALIRNLYLPSWTMEDLSGIDTTYDGIPAYEPAGDSRSVRAVDAGSGYEWFHAVGQIPSDGWPSSEVQGRLLEPLITRAPHGMHRTIVSQFRFVPRAEALERIVSTLTGDKARVYGLEKRKQVSTGEPEERVAAAELIRDDLGVGKMAGVLPMVRVLISAPDPVTLERGRKAIARLATDGLSATKWHWWDGRHAQAMATVLPFARGIRIR